MDENNKFVFGVRTCSYVENHFNGYVWM